MAVSRRPIGSSHRRPPGGGGGAGFGGVDFGGPERAPVDRCRGGSSASSVITCAPRSGEQGLRRRTPGGLRPGHPPPPSTGCQTGPGSFAIPTHGRSFDDRNIGGEADVLADPNPRHQANSKIQEVPANEAGLEALINALLTSAESHLSESWNASPTGSG